jgi:hypothetical protein
MFDYVTYSPRADKRWILHCAKSTIITEKLEVFANSRSANSTKQTFRTTNRSKN